MYQRLLDYYGHAVLDNGMTLREYLTSHSHEHLKDWHFALQFPLHNLYNTPLPLTNDWLNQYTMSKHVPQDYRFIYIGPKHSATLLHHDVLKSFSWSFNVTGKKLWIMFPAQATRGLFDRTGKMLVYDVRNVDPVEFPGFSESWEQRIEYIQGVGEIIVVPAGWYHQVHNLEDTISINHNFINEDCIDGVIDFLKEEWRAVQNSLSDLRDIMKYGEWIEECRKVLKLSSGMDMIELGVMLAQHNRILEL
jgi:hypothetical protein